MIFVYNLLRVKEIQSINQSLRPWITVYVEHAILTDLKIVL